MAQLCLWTKIRTKQWIVLGVSAFQCMPAGFLCRKCDNFPCLHTRQDQNKLHLKDDCFCQIVIFCRLIAGPLSEAKTHWMVNLLQLLNQLNFVGRHSKVFNAKFVSMMSPKCSIVENDGEWRFTHTFCHSSNIFGCPYCFLAFYALVYQWGCQFLSLFFTR